MIFCRVLAVALTYNLAILSHVDMFENGRARVSDPAAARSENVALPFLFAWFASFDAKKVASPFVPGTPGGRLVCVNAGVAERTAKKIQSQWQWNSHTWGWDFPWMAMAAARTGQPELAVEALLNKSGANISMRIQP